MRLDAIAIGHNPPDDVNVVIEVSIGGEPTSIGSRSCESVCGTNP